MVSGQFCGSPGPLLKTTPFGLCDITLSKGVCQGTTIALYPSSRTFLTIAFFAPVSITTTDRLSSPYTFSSLVDTVSMNFSEV